MGKLPEAGRNLFKKPDLGAARGSGTFRVSRPNEWPNLTRAAILVLLVP